MQIARPFPRYFNLQNARSTCQKTDKRTVVEIYHNKALVYPRRYDISNFANIAQKKPVRLLIWYLSSWINRIYMYYASLTECSWISISHCPFGWLRRFRENNGGIAPISSPDGFGVELHSPLTSPLGSELLGVIGLTARPGYGYMVILLFWSNTSERRC